MSTGRKIAGAGAVGGVGGITVGPGAIDAVHYLCIQFGWPAMSDPMAAVVIAAVAAVITALWGLFPKRKPATEDPAAGH